MIEAFIEAWFEHGLASDLTEVDEGLIRRDAESVLCSAGPAGLPLERLLPRLAGRDTGPGRTARAVCKHAFRPFERRAQHLLPDAGPSGSSAALGPLSTARGSLFRSLRPRSSSH